MFLRKVIQHLKGQNWTAIGIDLLIVVIGVFLGAQASNWNDERKVRQGEREFLRQLGEDLAADNASVKRKIVYHGDVLAAARRTDAFIRAGRPCEPGHCWPVLVDFFIASQWQDASASRGVLEALQRSPYPYDAALKRRLIDYYRTLAFTAQLNGPSDYRRTLRMRIPVALQEALWNCNTGNGDQQRVNLACRPAGAEAEVAAVVERLRRDRDLAEQLNFRTSTQIQSIRDLKARAAGGDVLVREVRAEAEG